MTIDNLNIHPKIIQKLNRFNEIINKNDDIHRRVCMNDNLRISPKFLNN